MAGVERGEPDFGPAKLASSEDFIGYAPVHFRGDPREGNAIIGGVIYMDRSLLPQAAEFGQFNILFGTTIGGILTLSLIILFLGRVITRPILRLAEAVANLRREGQLHEIVLPESDRETTMGY